jgi:hypothetical protein
MVKKLFFIYGCLSVLILSCSRQDPISPSQEERPQGDTIQRAYGSSALRIQEFDPINLDLKDHEVDDPAWLEIYNSADTAINLRGYALTNDLHQLQRWTFPDYWIAPRSLGFLFLSGKNIREESVSSDSIFLITPGYAWSDGDRSALEGPPGHSKALPYAGESVFYLDSLGRQTVSAALTLGDNSDLPEGLQWGSAEVGMNLVDLPESAYGVVDLSRCNTLVLRGYLEAGKELELSLAQEGMENWLGWAVQILGNGKADGEYRIALPAGLPFPDLKQITMLLLRTPKNYATTVRFRFHEIFAYKAPVRLHAGFSPSKSHDALWLVSPDSLLLDSVAYGDIPPGYSLGFDSLGIWGLLERPSPGYQTNLSALKSVLKAPQPNLDGGFYEGSLDIRLDVPAGVEVRYTLDGSSPNKQSLLYESPLQIRSTTVIRSVAWASGNAPSEVRTDTYFIHEKSSLPVVAIATDPGGLFDPDTGIYMEGPNPGRDMPYWGANWWSPRELPASFELFEIDGKRSVQQNAGLSIYGNWSRMGARKSINLGFREEYGKGKLRYSIFPAAPHLDRFEKIGIRANGNNATTDHIRDALAQSLGADLGIDHQQNRAALVFYNGKYYGIHRITEKADRWHPVANHGVEESCVDLFEAYGAATSGSRLDYDRMIEELQAMDLTDSLQMERIRSKIDLDNYLDYLSIQMYSNNQDWPANNIRTWRDRCQQGRWRWILFDLDFAFDSPNGGGKFGNNMFTFLAQPSVSDYPNGELHTRLYRKLMESPTVRARFVNRFCVLLAGPLSSKRVLARMDSLQREISAEVKRDLVRWNIESFRYDRQLEVIRNYARGRAGLMLSQMQESFALEDPVTITIGSTGGVVRVEGISIPQGEFTAEFFPGQSMLLQAIPNAGKSFVGWSDGNPSAIRRWTPTQGAQLSANFR